MLRLLQSAFAAVLLALGGCAATTTAQLSPAPQAPVCGKSTTAVVFWTTRWRADQKDVPAREAAAADGINAFFGTSGCFKSVSIQHLQQHSMETIQTAVEQATTDQAKVVLIAIRELGPTVRIGGSPALIEGGTEVVLDISEYEAAKAAPRRFTVAWRNGGPGVLKGVASLPHDMQAALATGLQPSA
jgi:hypothetical protein